MGLGLEEKSRFLPFLKVWESEWVNEWRLYTLSASEAIFRARTNSHNLFSPAMMITWWMKQRGNLPPGHDALLFSVSDTGSFICPVTQTRLDIPRPLPSHTDTAGHTKALDYPVTDTAGHTKAFTQSHRYDWTYQGLWLPSHTDTAGHTKAFDYPAMGHWVGGVNLVSFQVWGRREPTTCPSTVQTLTTGPPRPPSPRFDRSNMPHKGVAVRLPWLTVITHLFTEVDILWRAMADDL